MSIHMVAWILAMVGALNWGLIGLGGFMGGKQDFPLSVKRWLLRHEGIIDAVH